MEEIKRKSSFKYVYIFFLTILNIFYLFCGINFQFCVLVLERVYPKTISLLKT